LEIEDYTNKKNALLEEGILSYSSQGGNEQVF